MKAAYRQSFLIKLENDSKWFEPEMYKNDRIFWGLSLSGVTWCYSWCVPVSCYQLGAFVYEFEIEVFFRTYDLSYFKSNNTLYVPLGFYCFILLNFYL